VAAPKAFGAGADDGIRTRDLRFTKPLLYQLSYIGGGSEAAKMAPVESMSKKEGDGLREGDLVVWRSKLSEGCRGLRFQSLNALRALRQISGGRSTYFCQNLLVTEEFIERPCPSFFDVPPRFFPEKINPTCARVSVDLTVPPSSKSISASLAKNWFFCFSSNRLTASVLLRNSSPLLPDNP
jgi:hypothetical protein